MDELINIANTIKTKKENILCYEKKINEINSSLREYYRIEVKITDKNRDSHWFDVFDEIPFKDVVIEGYQKKIDIERESIQELKIRLLEIANKIR